MTATSLPLTGHIEARRYAPGLRYESEPYEVLARHRYRPGLALNEVSRWR